MGDEAFDCIANQLTGENFSEQEVRNAFRLLIVLCRQFCATRKSELVRLAIPFLEDARIGGRSAAANAAVSETRMIERVPSLKATQDLGEAMRLKLR